MYLYKSVRFVDHVTVLVDKPHDEIQLCKPGVPDHHVSTHDTMFRDGGSTFLQYIAIHLPDYTT